MQKCLALPEQKSLHTDFGISLITAHPVMQDMTRVFPPPMELALLALFMGTMFGIPLGVVATTIAARWRDQSDRFSSLARLFDASLPGSVCIGLLLFSAKQAGSRVPGTSGDILRRYRADRYRPDHHRRAYSPAETDVFWNALNHLVLPASILGYLCAGLCGRA